MERILSTLNTIKVVQQTHTQLLAELKTSAAEVCPESHTLPDLPFSTARDMVDWDAELGVNKEAKLQMKRHMVVQGGDTIKQKTARILKSIMSWDVAKQFSWFGAKGKMKFCELNVSKLLCTCLIENVKQNLEEATLKNVEKAAMSWFRHAAERAAAGQQRQRPLSRTSEQDNEALI
ncbi:uncharacterized protein LOC119462023 [Dermacentor silvarum]|nr:uncharacterized protein LOC119462023 [Dermacentor silvarum]